MSSCCCTFHSFQQCLLLSLLLFSQATFLVLCIAFQKLPDICLISILHGMSSKCFLCFCLRYLYNFSISHNLYCTACPFSLFSIRDIFSPNTVLSQFLPLQFSVCFSGFCCLFNYLPLPKIHPVLYCVV
jgi:hypothetical protein